jgi:hypothetical protein
MRARAGNHLGGGKINQSTCRCQDYGPGGPAGPLRPPLGRPTAVASARLLAGRTSTRARGGAASRARLDEDVLAALLALSLAGSGANPALGTYRVDADVRVSGVPLLRSFELRGDVVLRPGDGPRVIRARLAARGHACEVDGTLADDGALAFERGQRCLIALDDPGVRGDVEATLRAGRGRVRDGRIALDLELGLAGTVRVATGSVPGLAKETPVPVNGEASIHAGGGRDNSRAAEAVVPPSEGGPRATTQ